MNRLLAVALNGEQDIVAARQRARQIAALLGFDPQDQTRIATAVSEIARNAVQYAGKGTAEFSLDGQSAPQLMRIRIVDRGPGIGDLDAVLEGRYRSSTGMGLGILGARRLMDRCEIRTRPGEGSEIVLTKIVPGRAALVPEERIAQMTAALAASGPASTLGELEQQNRELLCTLTELREREEEMGRLNRELDDTNRGVVALYAELDERADQLRQADEMKTRFLSNMSHEFRTPLNSIRALSRLLLDRVDGPLGDEQAKQVTLIRKATDQLSDLVDDLLDLAKISAGKTEVRPTEFDVAELFGMLRGMLRPLLATDAVALHFEDVSQLPPLYTDEAKVSQILRNLVSNALKYTERGEVRVSAGVADEGRSLCIRVRDTGIGIEPQDQERIFEEFMQVAGPLQSKVKGTGLGLPLSRRLAALLGGTLVGESEPGKGSLFRLTLPLRYAPLGVEPAEPATQADPHRLGVLLVDSSTERLLEYERMLQATIYQLLPARSVRQARDIFASARPAVVVLDADFRGEHGWTWLRELKSNPETRRVPVVVTSLADDPNEAYALGADACLSKPPVHAELLARLDALTSRRLLIIDDDPVVRYTVRRFLGADVPILEAEDGIGGLRAAAQMRPSYILLDLQLPDLNGGEVLRQLKSSPTTRDIPVAIITSLDLDDDTSSALAGLGATVLPKSTLSAERLRRLLEAASSANPMAEV